MKTHLSFLLSAILFSGLLSGCHSTSAVVRATTTLSKAPSFECISNAVLHVPGVTQILPANVTPDPTWTVYHRLSRQLPYESFLYLENNGTRGMVTLKPQWKAPTILELSKIWIDKTPANAEVDRVRRVMDEIYSAIQEQCGNLPPPEAVRERFVNLKNYEKSLATASEGMKSLPR
ncbi:hypothetical protein [Pedosphaera parvula]|uniref:Lipoprotein n=1 Tax=Pedosphaera parvula (strain Ellin514) TaxID=320771 RepID=B9XBD1_PEDPL|nr:hypothetical protein [Pedosphaera parvula]EEF62816.1 hypothetical protein Cflav_PD5451 [Pedosphaera parvula Ellin514]